MRKKSTEIPSWAKHEILSKVLTFHTMSLMCKNCWVSWSGSRWCFWFFFLQDLKLSKTCKSMELDLRVSRPKPGITPCCVPVVRVGWQSPLTPLAKVEKISSSHSQHTKRNLCTSVVDQHPRDLQAEITNYWISLSFMLQNFAIHGNRIKSADCSTNGKRSVVLREIMQSVGRDLSIIPRNQSALFPSPHCLTVVPLWEGTTWCQNSIVLADNGLAKGLAFSKLQPLKGMIWAHVCFCSGIMPRTGRLTHIDSPCIWTMLAFDGALFGNVSAGHVLRKLIERILLFDFLPDQQKEPVLCIDDYWCILYVCVLLTCDRGHG